MSCVMRCLRSIFGSILESSSSFEMSEEYFVSIRESMNCESRCLVSICGSILESTSLFEMSEEYLGSIENVSWVLKCLRG